MYYEQKDNGDIALVFSKDEVAFSQRYSELESERESTPGSRWHIDSMERIQMQNQALSELGNPTGVSTDLTEWSEIRSFIAEAMKAFAPETAVPQAEVSA